MTNRESASNDFVYKAELAMGLRISFCSLSHSLMLCFNCLMQESAAEFGIKMCVNNNKSE